VKKEEQEAIFQRDLQNILRVFQTRSYSPGDGEKEPTNCNFLF